MYKTKYSVLLYLLFFSLYAYAQHTTIPIQLKNNLVFFKASVNGSQPLNFMFDTGAGETVMDNALATTLKLEISGTHRVSGASGPFEASISNSNQIQLGQLTLKDVEILLTPLDELSKAFGFNIDIIVGYDLLQAFAVEVNLDKMQLNISSFQETPKPTNAQALSVEILDSGQFTTKASLQVKGQQPVILSFMVDSGMPTHLAVFKNAIEKYQLMQAGKAYKKEGTMGAGGQIVYNRKGKIKSFSLGTKNWKKIPVTFAVNHYHQKGKPLHQLEGLIGQSILLDFNITYDLSNKIMWMEARKK